MSRKSKHSGTEMERLLGYLRRHRPRTARQLGSYVEVFLGLKVPGRRVCEDHDSPLDYLAYSFLGTVDAGAEGSGDCVVWANRGGGKTQMGAVASLLECVFRPGCQVRILGGSQEQSRHMYRYLRRGLEKGFGGQVMGKITANRCRFTNGSDVEVLAQSDRSVRGHHIQRLRCDEVELFQPEIYQAAQFVTQSRGGIAGQLEVLSTMHRPYGLMHEIVNHADENHMRVFKWCLWEVMERCGERNCSRCCLWEDCRGRAKNGDGYYRIDDAIGQKRRTSEATWKAEMLCREPNRQDLVFPEFSASRHVRAISYNANWPLYRSIDFGFSNPFVCLFIQTDGYDNVYVIDEHIKSRTTLARHAELIKEQYPYAVKATYCDPAGKQHSELTGATLLQELAALGIGTRCRPSRILDGLEMVRNFLAPGAGPTRLLMSPKCERLIRAFQSLHYKKPAQGPLSELPEKDGVHDHSIDALRYFFINRFAVRYPVIERRY